MNEITKAQDTIYNNILEHINKLVEKLEVNYDDEKFEASKIEVLNLIGAFRQEKLDKAIDDLKNSQEWEKFTVAFYGETNAGKSTIIESLRIYFQEEEKIKQQIEFKKNVKEYDTNKKTLESKIESIKNDILENKSNKEQLAHEFEAKKNNLEEKANQILFDDSKKKESSIIYKILTLLHIVSTKKSIDEIDLEINDKKVKHEKDIKNLDDLLITKNEELAKLENEIKSLETSILGKLKKLEDGQIIGDGRSDFTKKSTTYNFTYNNQEFAFLDVPGIEGHEEIVIDEISHAVKKAHAVFYVTSSSTPPQKGDEDKKGTLEKIKEHLGSQTEVYTIFNKRVKNPMQLNKALVSDDEKDSLKIVDEKINNILKENYAGHKIVSAKIAFLAIAKCLVANSQNYNEKKKFLDKFSTNELRVKANFDELCNFISNELIINTKQKIKKSNYNKANETLNELIDILDKALKNNFEPLYKQVVQEVDNASINLKNTLRKTRIDLDSVIAKALRDFENDTRKEIYRYADKNISDDSFKSRLEVLLEKQYEKIGQQIPLHIENELTKYNKSITDSLENFKRKVDFAIQDYQTLNFDSFDSKSAIDLKIDNGINGWKIAGSFLTVGGTAYTYWTIAAANSWNWVGWTMIAAGALTALLSFEKSIHKFFSDDYKMSEQKKAFEENIEKIIDNIKPNILGSIEPIKNELTLLVDKIIDDLESISSQRKEVNKHIKTILQDLVRLAGQIKLEGDK